MPDERAPESPVTPFDIVALGASAGGIEAVCGILRALPASFPAAIVAILHLRQAPSGIVEVFARYSELPVAWAREGTKIEAGRVYVCPPQHGLELHPDRTCSLTPRKTTLHPIDSTLESLAASYRARAAAVILTGMRNDGAKGVVAIKKLGGTVLAQSQDSAEQPSMPSAAIATGAVDMVLPLSEIGRALVTLLGTGALPRSGAQLAVLDQMFGVGGVMRPLLRRIDWAATPLGPIEQWPPALIHVVQVMLGIAYPAVVHWGDEHVVLYNDAYAELLDDLHPAAAGSVGAEIWREAWPAMRAMLDGVRRTGETHFAQDAPWLLDRKGIAEECYFNYSICAVHDGPRRGAGILSVAMETTEHVIAQRRGALLSALSSMPTVDPYEQLARVLSSNPLDIPFALIYEIEPAKVRATLAMRAGVPDDAFMARPAIQLAGTQGAWPIDAVVRSRAPLLTSDVRSRFGDPVPGPWADPPREALLLPLYADGGGGEDVSGVLIAGLSPARIHGASDRVFFESVAWQVAAYLAVARMRSEDKLRARAHGDADRAKTEFFSDVSHEFRTPLTLAIAPIERLLASDTLPEGVTQELELAYRNARRLLHLVNQLLDFTRAEAHRLEPSFELVDLAKETTDLVALFRSAIERAELKLNVDCPPLSAPVRLDREMWEKIVGNLLANALKFTYQGEIAVELRERAQHAELIVRDTGVGIPAAELPNLFGRFHRVRGARARTQEGSGIGLALTRQLVRLQGGQMRVKSVEGQGAAFTVWIPMQATRSEPSPPPPAQRSLATASMLAEIALSWVESDPVDVPLAPGLGEDAPFLSRTAGARVLVADDNADMRTYLGRLLVQAGWQVRTVADGAEATEQLTTFRPDLVLTDVWMPNVDGFELLRRVRTDADLQGTPVVLITGRAGEAAAIEGMMAGADDHITKPFTARELVARVGAQLELARVRNRNAQRDAYTVKLHTALRGLSDALAIEAAACRVLVQELRCKRAYYAELEQGGRYARIFHDDSFGAPSAVRLYDVASYGELMMDLVQNRRPFVSVGDIDRDERLGDCRERWRAASTIAAIAVPLIQGAKVVGLFLACDDKPREWTSEEIALTQETADRTWEAMARARAEAATALAIRRSDLLRELAERSAPDGQMHVLYEDVLTTAIALTSAHAGTVQMLDRETMQLVLLTARNFSAETAAYYRALDASSGSSCGRALARHDRAYVDFTKLPEDPDAKRHIADGYGSALSTPLVTRGGELIGMITTHWADVCEPDAEVLRFIDLLARQAADLIERGRTREQLLAQQAENERLRAEIAGR